MGASTVKEGGIVLVWVLWAILLIVTVAVIAALSIFYSFRRWRRVFPRPDAKRPVLKPNLDSFPDDEVTVCWIGHSTVYVNFFGVGILTDPVFSDRVGLHLMRLFTVGVKRHTAPALTIDDVIDEVDVILLSHAHMDHFDMPSLRNLQRRHIEVVTAGGTGRLLRRLSFGRVTELSGQDRIHLQAGVDVQAVPVRHWGNRFPWNKGYGFTGYLIERHGVRLFFAGDTAYTPSFADLRAGGPIHLALIPIGAYSPEKFQGNHCTPEQAWQMFCDTGAKWLAPIHWDTFVLSKEPVEEPLNRLMAAGDARKIVLRRHGEAFRVSPN